MASVAAPFVRIVPGPGSLLVPISRLLAAGPLAPLFHALLPDQKIQEMPVLSSNSHFYCLFPSLVLFLHIQSPWISEVKWEKL